MDAIFLFWMFVPQTWVIIAIIAILLELTDGSRIFFLPIGLAALLVAAHLQMVFSNVIARRYYCRLVLADHGMDDPRGRPVLLVAFRNI